MINSSKCSYATQPVPGHIDRTFVVLEKTDQANSDGIASAYQTNPKDTPLTANMIHISPLSTRLFASSERR